MASFSKSQTWRIREQLDHVHIASADNLIAKDPNTNGVTDKRRRHRLHGHLAGVIIGRMAKRGKRSKNPRCVELARVLKKCFALREAKLVENHSENDARKQKR